MLSLNPLFYLRVLLVIVFAMILAFVTIRIKSNLIQEIISHEEKQTIESFNRLMHKYEIISKSFSNYIIYNENLLKYLYSASISDNERRELIKSLLQNDFMEMKNKLELFNFESIFIYLKDGKLFNFISKYKENTNQKDLKFLLNFSKELRKDKLGYNESTTGICLSYFFPLFIKQEYIGFIELVITNNLLRDNLISPSESFLLLKRDESSSINNLVKVDDTNYYLIDYLNLREEDKNIILKNKSSINLLKTTYDESITKKNYSFLIKNKGSYLIVNFIAINDIFNNHLGYIVKLKSSDIIELIIFTHHFILLILILFSTFIILLLHNNSLKKSENSKKEEKIKDLIDTLNILKQFFDIIIINDKGKVINYNIKKQELNELFKTKDAIYIYHIFPELKKYFDEEIMIDNQLLEVSLVINYELRYYNLYITRNILKNNTNEYFVILQEDKDKNEQKNIKNKYSLIIEQCPLAIVITDIDGYIEYVNNKFCLITGYEKDELLGKKTNILKSDKLTAIDYVSLWQTIKSGKIWEGEFYNKKKDGSYFWVHSIIFPLIDQDKIINFIAIEEDITEKKYISELLEKTKNQYESLFENLAIGIVIVKNRVIYRANKVALNMFGFQSIEEVLGKTTDFIYLSKEQYYDVEKKYSPIILEGGTYIGEELVKKKNGELIWIKIIGRLINPLKPDDGIIWLIEDITEQKKLQEEILVQKMIAERANRAKTEFIANMSHEIRTPIQAIIGLIELSIDKSKDEDQRQYLLKALTSSEYLLDLVNEILDYSRIEFGKYELEIKEFSIMELFNKLIPTYKTHAQQKNLTLDFNINLIPDYYLLGDPHNLMKIFINLISNAIKFTEKGEIKIDCVLEEIGLDKILLTFKVQDTGIGMKKEKMKDIFDAFSQADSSISKKYGGTGLGLTIVKKLVDLMQGEISVESELGKGSTFIIKVPLLKGNKIPTINLTESQDTPINSLQLDKYHILIVEDNDINRELIRLILVNEGFVNIDLANNGLDALLCLTKKTYDIIILDAQMPVIDGFTTTKIIRAFEQGKKLYIPEISNIINDLKKLNGQQNILIMLTAHAIKDYHDHAINLGVNEYLTKPIKKNQLLSIIYKYLQFNRKEDDNQIFDNKDKEVGTQQASNLKEEPQSSLRQKIIDHLKNQYELPDENISIILETTKETLEKNLSELENAIIKENFNDIFTYSHAIKGSLINLGFNEYASIAKEIEIAARKKNNIDYYSLFKRLEEEVKMITSSL